MKEMSLNPLPALTWNWLRMNKASFEESAEWEKGQSPLECSGLPAGAKFSKGQEAAARIKGAMGKDFDGLLDQNAAPTALLKLPSDFKSQEPIFVRASLQAGAASFQRLFVKAGDNVEANVIIEWRGSTQGAPGGEKNARGLNAFQTKIAAGNNCKIRVSTVQLLGAGFVHLNDIGTAAGENSSIEIAQLELGAKKIFMGIHSGLSSARAAFKHSAAYCLDKDRELDMNFVALQTGRATQSDMSVFGTLMDDAKKTYRGTIDFRKGCTASVGNEIEETLLLSPDVVNKSIPLILCDEEDVQGEHGATIGRLDESVLFYMNARGISLEEAQKMMARAKIARVAALLGDETEAQKALDFFDEHFGGDK